jgi:hypothetical protein
MRRRGTKYAETQELKREPRRPPNLTNAIHNAEHAGED